MEHSFNRTQRSTLAVVCAATAMLMLDIAVVNTALSAIASDLDTGILNPTVSQVALSTAPPKQSGLAAGVNDMFRQAGIALALAAAAATALLIRGRPRVPAGEVAPEAA
jgi:hypothetical protein